MQTTTATYCVPASKIDGLSDQIDKLNKRAKKLGLEQISYVVNTTPAKVQWELQQDGGKHIKTIDTRPGAKAPHLPGYHLTGRVLPFHTVAVSGQKPQIDGWEFVAVLEPVQLDNGKYENFVRSVPGVAEQLPVNLRDRIGDCDHCHTKRSRKETFVLRSIFKPTAIGQTWEHKVVGRQCLKDFTGGHHDPHQLAAVAELLFALNDACQQASDDEDCFGGGSPRQDKCFDLQQVLEWTCTMIQAFGWVSRTKANESYDQAATADHVIGILVRPREKVQEWEAFRTKHQPTTADTQRAEAAIEWAASQTGSDNDYLQNVNLVARMGYTTRSTFGVAVSIMAAYNRAIEQAEAAKRTAASEWQGTIGKRQEFTVTVLSIFGSVGEYGTTGIHRLMDENGNLFTWFASPGGTWLTERKQITIAASVKAHDTYKGVKTTIITRVKEKAKA